MRWSVAADHLLTSAKQMVRMVKDNDDDEDGNDDSGNGDVDDNDHTMTMTVTIMVTMMMTMMMMMTMVLTMIMITLKLTVPPLQRHQASPCTRFAHLAPLACQLGERPENWVNIG